MSHDPLRRYLQDRTDESFQALVREKGSVVFNAAYRVLRNRALAEDAAQDVFLSLLSPRWKPDHVREADGFLASMGMSRALTLLRAEARRRKREHRAGTGGLATEPEFSERLEIDEALESRPEPLRRCTRLRFYGGLAAGELARTLDLPVREVHTRIRRALEILRPRLAAPVAAVILPAFSGALDAAPGREPMPESLLSRLREGPDLAAHVRREIVAHARKGARRGAFRAGAAAALVLCLVGIVALLRPWTHDRAGPAPTASGLPAPPATEGGKSREARTDSTGNDKVATRDLHSAGAAGRPLEDPSAAAPGQVEPAESLAPAAGERRTGPAEVEIHVLTPSGALLSDGTVRGEIRPASLGVVSPALLERLGAPDGQLAPHSLSRGNPWILRELPAALDGAALRIEVEAEGLALPEPAVVALAAGETSVVKLTLFPVRQTSIVARDGETMAPVQGAVVYLGTSRRTDDEDASASGAFATEEAGTTGPDGRLLLSWCRPGRAEIHVQATGYFEESRSSEMPREMLEEDFAQDSAAAIAREVTVLLRPLPDRRTSRFTLLALSIDSRPLPGTEVQVRGPERSTVPFRGSTDSLGLCTIEGLTMGDHVVQARFASTVPVSMEKRFLVEPGEDVSMTLQDPGRASSARLRVLDAGGSALADVPVTISKGATVLSGRTDATGTVELEDLEAGRYELTVGPPACGWALPALEVPEGSSVERASALGDLTVRGRLSFPRAPRPGAICLVRMVGEGRGCRVPAGPDGQFSVDRALPGEYEISAECPEEPFVSPTTRLILESGRDLGEIEIDLVEPAEADDGPGAGSGSGLSR